MPCPELKTSQDPGVKGTGKNPNGKINHHCMI